MNHQCSFARASVVAAVMVAASVGLTGDRGTSATDKPAAGEAVIAVKMTSQQLACDGDSTKLTVRAANNDGSGAAGVEVRVSLEAGTVQVRGQRETGSSAAGTTDSAGAFEARLTPAPGTKVKDDVLVEPGDNGGPFSGVLPTNHKPEPPVQVQQAGAGEYQIACPFSNDMTYSIQGDLWEDSNGDGLADGRTRILPHTPISLGLTCYHCSIIAHTTFTDDAGRFSWSGLQFGTEFDPNLSSWHVCLDSSEFEMTSVNGAPYTPTNEANCLSLPLNSFQPGVNELSIGARDLRRSPS